MTEICSHAFGMRLRLIFGWRYTRSGKPLSWASNAAEGPCLWKNHMIKQKQFLCRCYSSCNESDELPSRIHGRSGKAQKRNSKKRNIRNRKETMEKQYNNTTIKTIKTNMKLCSFGRHIGRASRRETRLLQRIPGNVWIFYFFSWFSWFLWFSWFSMIFYDFLLNFYRISTELLDNPST